MDLMNPFATIPIEERYAEFHKRYPALNLIGNTRMVEILCFREEFPEIRVYAKAEYTNPGGSLKDRPVRRMLLEALIEGNAGIKTAIHRMMGQDLVRKLVSASHSITSLPRTRGGRSRWLAK